MMSPYTLTDSEMVLCRTLANLRTMVNYSTKRPDPARVRLGSEVWSADEMGVFGEYGFCKLNNIFFDPTTHVRSGGYDFIFRGVRVDMKTTKLPHGKLHGITKWQTKPKDVDAYALAILTGNTLAFPGWCSAKFLYQEENLTNFGYDDVYAIPQSKLRAWKDDEEIENICKRQGGHFSVA